MTTKEKLINDIKKLLNPLLAKEVNFGTGSTHKFFKDSEVLELRLKDYSILIVVK